MAGTEAAVEGGRLPRTKKFERVRWGVARRAHSIRQPKKNDAVPRPPAPLAGAARAGSQVRECACACVRLGANGGTPTDQNARLLSLRHAALPRRRRHAPRPPAASKDDESFVSTAVKAASSAADAAAGLVPEAVPRPVAKGGVVVVGGLVVASVAGKLVSTLLFWGAVLGGGWLLFKSSGSGGGGGGSSGSSDDPLAEARRIMDKYK